MNDHTPNEHAKRIIAELDRAIDELQDDPEALQHVWKMVIDYQQARFNVMRCLRRIEGRMTESDHRCYNYRVNHHRVLLDALKDD